MIGPEFHGGGHPWHGLCQDGQLTLPNANTKPYPQPAGGDCFKLTVPGFGAPVRSAEKLSADASLGHGWLNHVLVSGDSRATNGLQVYGKPLGPMRWIWAISADEKWLVNASALVVSSGPSNGTLIGTLAGNLLLTRFGIQQPNVPAETRTLTISAGIGCAAVIAMRLMDISASGDKVVIGFYAEPDGLRYADPMRLLPVATMEVALMMPDSVPAATLVSRYTQYDAITTFRRILYKIDGGVEPYLNAQTVGIYEGPIEFYITRSDPASTGTVVTKLGIRSVISSTNTSGTSVVDFVPPTLPVRLAGSDVSACSGGGLPIAYDYSYTGISIADIEAQAASTKAVLEAQVNGFFSTNIVSCNGAPVVQYNVLRPDAGHRLGTQDQYTFIWDYSIQSELVVVNETDLNGVVIRRYAQYRLYESWMSRYYTADCSTYPPNFTAIDSGPITHTHVLTYSSDRAYYFRKTTTPTGAISYRVWAGLFACQNPQYLLAPDLGSTGAGAYTYLVNAQLFLQVDGVEVADLGSFSYTVSSPAAIPPVGISAYIINQGAEMTDQGLLFGSPIPGKHDRFAVVMGHLPTPVAEVLFANPCAGLVAFAFRNMVPGTTQKQWYLHKFIRAKDGTTAPWSGWSDFSVYDHRVTLHPVTGEIQAIPNKAVCFV